MIESRLHLFDIKQIIFLIDSMIFMEPFFSIAPKTFNAIDMIVTFAKCLGMLNFIVLSILLQILVGFEIISVKY